MSFSSQPLNVVYGYYYPKIHDSSDQSHYIKIGCTNNLLRRMTQWEKDDGYTPYVVFTCPSTDRDALEKIVHQYFGADHIPAYYIPHGITKQKHKRIEWFKTKIPYTLMPMIVSLLEIERVRSVNAIQRVRSIVSKILPQTSSYFDKYSKFMQPHRKSICQNAVKQSTCGQISRNEKKLCSETTIVSVTETKMQQKNQRLLNYINSRKRALKESQETKKQEQITPKQSKVLPKSSNEEKKQ